MGSTFVESYVKIRMVIGKVSIQDLNVFAHIGVHPVEHLIGRTFVVNIHVWYPIQSSSESDELSQTLDYGLLAKTAQSVLQNNPDVHLLEKLCVLIQSKILNQYPLVTKCQISIKKLRPLIDGLEVGASEVEWIWEREVKD